jgi:aryl-alcohol dehydrogenase-like predicted oxidoreductase
VDTGVAVILKVGGQSQWTAHPLKPTSDRTYSPLHAGLLAGALQAGSEDDRIDAHRDQLEAYEGLCRDLGAKPAGVALAWLLRNPVVSAAIVAPRTSEELRSSLGALSVHLDADVAQRLDRIWPGPGEAPQAYAW